MALDDTAFACLKDGSDEALTTPTAVSQMGNMGGTDQRLDLANN